MLVAVEVLGAVGGGAVARAVVREVALHVARGSAASRRREPDVFGHDWFFGGVFFYGLFCSAVICIVWVEVKE